MSPVGAFLQPVLWSTCHRNPLINNPHDWGGEDEAVDAIQDAPVAWEQASGEAFDLRLPAPPLRLQHDHVTIVRRLSLTASRG